MQKMQEHGFLRSRFIPVFVLKSLAKENGVQFPKMQSFYSLVLVNSCAKFTKTGDFVRNWLFFVNYILLTLSENRLLCRRKQCF